MKYLPFKIIFLTVFITAALLPLALNAGASGTISGYVQDKETGHRLPGASIVIEGTNFGAMAGKHGFYIIYNVPVGTYTLKASVIGYVPMKVTNVTVKTDLNTGADFSLSGQVLEAPEEVEVTTPRVQILRDVLTSTQYFDEETIDTKTPALTFYDLLSLVPGYVANHFRGGRNSSVQLLVDGLPASGSVTREMAFFVPNSAIAEMVVQTGGFSTEYGNVTSGTVNIITKDGRNDLIGTLKVAGQIPVQSERNYDNSKRAEFALGGPFRFSFGGPLIDGNYLISGNTHFTDTPFRKELNQFFGSPHLFNYDLNSKLMLRISNNIYLRGQYLLSNWEWRRFDELWAGRESALPKRYNQNRRVDLSMTHTLSPRMYYKIELSRLDLERQVKGENLPRVTANLHLNSIQSLDTVWPGEKEPWQESLHERRWFGRINLVRQLHPIHQLKLGMEANYWDLALDRSRYLLWPNGTPSEFEFVYSRYVDSFRRNPYSFSVYGDHKIELSRFIAKIGLRYELFSPNATPTLLPGEPVPTRSDSIDVPVDRQRYKHTFAPRFSLAIPIRNTEHLSINYGWFFELPSFYHLYLNSSGDTSARWPIFGNVDIQPIRARAWEVTYRRAISDRSVFTLTGFLRRYKDLIDTVAYPTVDENVPNGEEIVFRYENRATAIMRGVELAYRRQLGRHFSGRVTYTYLNSSGTASWARKRIFKSKPKRFGSNK